MAKGDATRQRILEAAADQATVRGLAAVSLNDVAEAVGLSKSGVFKHFQAKDALDQAVLEAGAKAFVEAVWEPAAHLPKGRPRLEAIIEHWMDWGGGSRFSGGCPLTAATTEFDDQPGPLRDFIKEQQLRWRRRLAAEITALRNPPLAWEEAELGAFELHGLMLAFFATRRLLDDEGARAKVSAGCRRLLDRYAAA